MKLCRFIQFTLQQRALIAFALTLPASGLMADPAKLPAEFSNDLVVLVSEAASGVVVRFHTDTGGGWNMISKSVAERLELPPMGQIAADEGTFDLVPFPEFVAGKSIPEVGDATFNNGHLVVVPDKFIGFQDAFLGGRWFANGVWEFDYPRRTLRFLGRDSTLVANADNTVSLGFQHDQSGKRTTQFPRIRVHVSGEPLDLLFDTGATISLSDEAAREFELAPGEQVGGSFISATVFDRWRSANPDWMVIEDGDARNGMTADLIQVPAITIAGLTAGPVWFAKRPAGTFESWMSGMMDAPVVGALGGSGFRYFKITIDYPAALAHFIMQGR